MVNRSVSPVFLEYAIQHLVFLDCRSILPFDAGVIEQSLVGLPVCLVINPLQGRNRPLDVPGGNQDDELRPQQLHHPLVIFLVVVYEVMEPVVAHLAEV